MTLEIDFASLSLKDALDLAILVEDEAMERYNEFTDQMLTHHTEDSAHFFRFMAGKREEARRRAAGAPARSCSEMRSSNVDRSLLFDVEAPTYDRARAFMSVHAALRVALDAEVKAWTFFDKALPTIKDPDVKALFSELREEEVEHQDMVKGEMAKLPPEKDLDPDDFVDPPVAQ